MGPSAAADGGGGSDTNHRLRSEKTRQYAEGPGFDSRHLHLIMPAQAGCSCAPAGTQDTPRTRSFGEVRSDCLPADSAASDASPYRSMQPSLFVDTAAKPTRTSSTRWPFAVGLQGGAASASLASMRSRLPVSTTSRRSSPFASGSCVSTQSKSWTWIYARTSTRWTRPACHGGSLTRPWIRPYVLVRAGEAITVAVVIDVDADIVHVQPRPGPAARWRLGRRAAS